MKLSIGIITDNSTKWIHKIIKRLGVYLQLPTVELIFIDNMSEDDTVPKIVSMIGKVFMDEERAKFYINKPKKTLEESIEMFSKLASCEKRVIIKENINKKELERLIRRASK